MGKRKLFFSHSVAQRSTEADIVPGASGHTVKISRLFSHAESAIVQILRNVLGSSSDVRELNIMDGY